MSTSRHEPHRHRHRHHRHRRLRPDRLRLEHHRVEHQRSSTTDKAKDTASTAADQGKQVAGTAKDEALNVAGTAAEQARNVVGEAKQQVTSQLSDQATTGRDKLSQTLRTLGDDLQQMAQGQGPSQGLATDLAQEVSDRVRAFGSHLENRDPGQLLDDARDFARRRPGTFLVGALAAGVVAGRMFRATADGAAAASLAESGGTGRRRHRHGAPDRPDLQHHRCRDGPVEHRQPGHDGVRHPGDADDAVRLRLHLVRAPGRAHPGHAVTGVPGVDPVPTHDRSEPRGLARRQVWRTSAASARSWAT